MKALTWRSPDGTTGWLVDTMHPGRLDERLHTFGDFPELHAEIVDVDLVMNIERAPIAVPIPDLERGGPG